MKLDCLLAVLLHFVHVRRKSNSELDDGELSVAMLLSGCRFDLLASRSEMVAFVLFADPRGR